MHFESGPMFIWSVRVSYKFPACWGESVKFQTCLIFLRPLPTLVSDPYFSPLATDLLVNLMVCQLHFAACRLIKQACLLQVFGLSQIWTSRLYVMTHRLYWKCYSPVGNFSRPVCKCSRQACKLYRPVGNFYSLGPRVRKICNRQAIN